jgi:hypothetical protein
MATFLDTFPKIQYDINRNNLSNYETITNITFRVGIIKGVLSNFGSYFTYDIQEGDTPEILAYKIYNNPEAYWIILYANDIYDPYYDWPLTTSQLSGLIVKKYGSIAWAKTNWHHYEKVVTKEVDNIITTERYIINADKLTNNELDVPYDYYDNIADGQAYTAYTVNGKTVKETISRNRVSYYDYESDLNESKRQIKIIKKDYYAQILSEFKNLSGSAKASYVRSLS